ncbi:hypothetical protein C6P96_10800 [Burkholderia multivorans]|nr:hypothetical protein C6P95_15685 [Burkholderia multivorans]PRF14538.1 hypothetical protein C6P96_10800 [Burkholderia multivorans]
MTRAARTPHRRAPVCARTNRVKSAGVGNTVKCAFSLRPFDARACRGRCHCDARYRLSRIA